MLLDEENKKINKKDFGDKHQLAVHIDPFLTHVCGCRGRGTHREGSPSNIRTVRKQLETSVAVMVYQDRHVADVP